MEKTLDFVAHLFVPRHSNNNKARLLHPEILAIFIVGMIFSQFVIHSVPSVGIRILGYAANISPTEVVNLTNQKRQEAGVDTLEISPALTAAAKAKGEHMLANNYWAHVAPDGTEPWSFFIANGYKYRYAGENLARDFTNPNSTVEAWMASPSHRENLLSTKYKEIGVAVVEGDLDGVDTTIVVQLFGSRLIDTTPQLPLAEAKTETVESVNTSLPSPTITPTVPPVLAQVSPVPTQGSVLLTNQHSVSAPATSLLLNPFDITRNFSLVTVVMLLGVMVIDGVVARKRNVSRVGGRVFAHIAFFGMVLAVVIIARAGIIL